MEKPDFVYVTYIRTTPQKLWEALTTPKITCDYWGGMTNNSDWKTGSRWEHHNPEDKEDPVYIFGEIVESTPCRRLVMTWVDPENPSDHSLVTLEIEPFDDMARLKVIHGNFPDGSPMKDKVSNGWPRVLSSLKSYLETGKGIDIKACGSCGG